MRRLLISSFCCFIAAYLLSSFTFAQTPHEAYIVQQNPPAVAVFDTTNWNQTATIPLESRPRVAQFDARSATLYIVAEELPAIPSGRDGQSASDPNRPRLIVIDAVARQIRQNIPLGSGWTVRCSPTANKGRLLCECYSNNPDRTQVTVIDAEKNFESAAIKLDYLAALAANADASRLFVLERNKRDEHQNVLHAFDRRTESGVSRYEPAKSLQLLGYIRGQDMVLSPEGSWLYVLARGVDSDKTKHEEDARVYVVETKEPTIAAEFPVANHIQWPYKYQLGINPATGHALYVGGDYTGRLVEFNGAATPLTIETGPLPRWHRIGDQQGIWITTIDEMRYLPAGGTGTTTRIALAGSSAQEISIGGDPGPMIYLPQQRKGVMLITDREGNAKGKVALIDFRQQRLGQVITTGKSSSGSTIANVVLGLAAGFLALGMNEGFGCCDGEPQRYAQLVPTTDGSLVYALNSVTNDVTVIRTADGVVLDRVKICHCAVLSPTPGVRFIVAHFKIGGEDDELTWLDTRSNKVKSQLKLSKERVRATAAVVASNVFVVLTSRALLLWNSDNGELVRRTNNMSDPIGIFGTEIGSITTLPIDDSFSFSRFAVD